MARIVAIVAVLLFAPPAAPAAPAASDGPPVLRRLAELDAKTLPPLGKAKLGLRLYRDEMVHRTPLPRPQPGQPPDLRTHDYVLARLTERLAQRGADVPYLLLAWQRANPGEVKDSLGIFLTLKGRPEAKDDVAAYVTVGRSPLRLKELAVRALGEYAVKKEDASLGKAIAQAVRDDAQAVYRPGTGGKPGVMVFPVKRAGVEAIRKMEKAGLLLESFVTAAADQAQVELPLPEGKR